MTDDCGKEVVVRSNLQGCLLHEASALEKVSPLASAAIVYFSHPLVFLLPDSPVQWCSCYILMCVCCNLQVNPGCSCFRRVKVHNSTKLPFPFKWQVEALQLPAAAGGAAAGSTAVARRSSAASQSNGGVLGNVQHDQQHHQQQQCPSADTEQSFAFAVHPSTGVLQAGEVREFIVEFAPPAVAEHAASAVLLVERSGDAFMTSLSPAAARKSRTSCSSSGSGSIASAAGDTAAAVEAAVAAARLAAGDSGWDAVVTLGLEGLGVPICLAVQPSAVVALPGHLTVGEVQQQLLVLQNESPAPAHFSIEAAASNSRHNSRKKMGKQNNEQPAVAVEVVPSSGIIPSCGSMQLTANFTGLAAGTHTEKLLCRVTHGPSISLSARAVVAEAAVVPAQAVLDFGVICVGNSSTQQLQLCNAAASYSTDWRLEQLDPQVRRTCGACMVCMLCVIALPGCFETAVFSEQ
jgi:hypothetical protein